jgi:hypothetical protein
MTNSSLTAQIRQAPSRPQVRAGRDCFGCGPPALPQLMKVGTPLASSSSAVLLSYGTSLERHVPVTHLLRSIDRFVDLSDIGNAEAALIR